MQTNLTAVTALTCSLLLPLIPGPTQAASAPDLKNAVSASIHGGVTLVHAGGGGGGGGGHGVAGWGGGGHPGAMALFISLTLAGEARWWRRS
jgi:hypothetical protein